MQFISERVDLLSDQAERWSRHHEEVKLCWDTEDLAAEAVQLWSTIKRDGTRNPIDPDAADADERARDYSSLYAKLHATMTLIDNIGRQDIAKGYVLEGWAAFTQARLEVADAAAVPVESVLRGIRQARAGQVRPLGEVRRDLERRLHA